MNKTNEPSLLILTSGEVLRGIVKRDHDFYRVELPHGHLTIREGQVEQWCRSLEDAYLFRRAGIRFGDVEEHLSLTRWCLRHELADAAAEQLRLASQANPRHPMVDFLSRRLTMLRESIATRKSPYEDATPIATIDPNVVPCAATTEVVANNNEPSTEELGRMVRSLPVGSVEKFTRNIQPILMHSCATTNCHGASAKSDFQLTRIPIGRPAGKKYTQRNLYATLRQIDHNNPQSSPLLNNARQAHGSSNLPAMTMRHLEQYRALINWTIQIANSNCSMPTETAPKPQPITTASLQSTPSTDGPIGLQPLPQFAATPTVENNSPQPTVAATQPAAQPRTNETLDSSPPQLLPQDASDARLLDEAYENSSSAVTHTGHWQPSPQEYMTPIRQPQRPAPASTSPAPNTTLRAEPSENPKTAQPATENRTTPPSPYETSENRVQRGDPTTGLFQPQDPFDPAQFNRRYHGNPPGSITFGSAQQ